MKIYLITYCQNGYQRERVRRFVEGDERKIVNPEFGMRNCDKKMRACDGGGRWDFGLELIKHDNESELVTVADEAWFIAGNPRPWGGDSMFYFERLAKRMKKPLKYFKIAQTGGYAGIVRETTRAELAGLV